MYTLNISIKPRKGRRMSGVYLASCFEGRKSRDIPEGARPVSANKRAIMFFLVSSQPVILMIESTSNRGTLPPFFLPVKQYGRGGPNRETATLN